MKSLITNLIDLLIDHEGVRHKPYKCTAGKLTIGVGRNLEDMGLSDDEIYYMLKNDIRRVDEELNNAFRFYKNLDPVRKDAMINMGFNLGIPRLRSFRMALKCMELGEYEEASMEFLDSLWAEQVGRRALDVSHMIKYGEYPNADG